jgi:hypothetical protein
MSLLDTKTYITWKLTCPTYLDSANEDSMYRPNVGNTDHIHTVQRLKCRINISSKIVVLWFMTLCRWLPTPVHEAGGNPYLPVSYPRKEESVTSGWHSSPLPSFLVYPFPLHRDHYSCFPLPSSNQSWPRERPTLLAKGLSFYLQTCPHLKALNWFFMYSFG